VSLGFASRLNSGSVQSIIQTVSDDKTQNLADGRSFEERVFARFDALDARMSSMEARLSKVEARLDDMDARLQTLEQKSYDTKPIWERALAEILSVGEKMDDLGEKMHKLERRVMTLAGDMLTLRADQSRLEDKMDKLESKPMQ
jgi:chromosome segregation ATPase